MFVETKMWRERERNRDVDFNCQMWKKNSFVIFSSLFLLYYPIRRIVDSCSLFQQMNTMTNIGRLSFFRYSYFVVGFFWEEMKNDRVGYNKRFKTKKKKLGYIYYESYLSNTKRIGFTSLYDFNCSPLQLLNEKQ